MIRPDQIPDAVVEAAAYAYRYAPPLQSHDEAIAKAIVAALNAWPGAFPHPLNKTRLVLPLPEARSADAKPQQEGSDE